MTEPKQRCDWCIGDDDYETYHDHEWGFPEHRNEVLFEFLILEGAQAGLSWITVLRKRNAYREAFDHFDAIRIAGYDDVRKRALMSNAGIIRNRLKIDATIGNARSYLAMMERGEDFSEFLWGFVGGSPRQNAFEVMGEIPASTPESNDMSKALKKLGFKFVGPTICYALMQATGMVNDHLTGCFRYDECKAAGASIVA